LGDRNRLAMPCFFYVRQFQYNSLLWFNPYHKNGMQTDNYHFNTTPCYGSTYTYDRVYSSKILFQYNSLLRFNGHISRFSKCISSISIQLLVTVQRKQERLYTDTVNQFQYNSLLRFNFKITVKSNGRIISIQLLVTVQQIKAWSIA